MPPFLNLGFRMVEQYVTLIFSCFLFLTVFCAGSWAWELGAEPDEEAQIMNIAHKISGRDTGQTMDDTVLLQVGSELIT